MATVTWRPLVGGDMHRGRTVVDDDRLPVFDEGGGKTGYRFFFLAEFVNRVADIARASLILGGDRSTVGSNQ